MSAASGGIAVSASHTGTTADTSGTAADVASMFRALEGRYDVAAEALTLSIRNLERLRASLSSVLSSQGAVR